MQPDYWLKQTSGKALFEDLLWSRPENRQHAGKLLIVGGQAQGFAAPAEAYAQAQRAGAGTVRVLLPDVLRKSVGRAFEAGEYAPSTPSGSFAQTALNELLAMAHWADGTLLAGDIGRNSETAILLEKFLGKHQGQVTITKDTLEYITTQPLLIQNRPETLLVLSYSQLQKLAIAMRFPMAFTFDIDLLRLTATLHSLTSQYPFAIITKHLDQLLVSIAGQVSTTPYSSESPIWRLKTASAASVWWLQNPRRSFEALTTSLSPN